MNLNLSDRRALVCGSTQGIGKAIAIELAALGASVTLLARDRDKLEATVKELRTAGKGLHSFICADFTDPEMLRTRVREYIKEQPDIHILINNTGGPPGGAILEAKTGEFLQALNNHLLCNHLLVQEISPGMKRLKYGRIINVISTSVKQPIPGLGVSNTTRAAVASWAKTLSHELAPFGITVNNVLPGATRTVRLKSLLEARASKTGHSLDALEKEMLHEIPAGRFAEPSEVAALAAFLASPAASYINGTSIPVDGGRTACI